MIHTITRFLITFLFICTIPQKILAQQEYEQILLSIQSLHIVSQGQVPDGGITIKKDAATFSLKKGLVYKFSQILNRESFLLFRGTGQFIFEPPTEIERAQLYRLYEKNSLDETFESLFLGFADTLTMKYFSNIVFEKIETPGLFKKDYEYPLSFLLDTEKGYFDRDFMLSFLEGKNNPLFYAHIEFDDFERLFFRLSPFDYEEISLSRKVSTIILPTRETDLICSFHLNNNYSGSSSRKHSLPLLNIPQYKINFFIDNNLESRGECELVFNLNQPKSNWVYLYLSKEFVVDSIRINSIPVKTFYRGEENPELWIKLPHDVDRAGNNSMKVFYHGNVLDKDEFGWVAIKSLYSWYPRLHEKINSFFEINFVYPKNYELVSIGEKTSLKELDDFNTSSWHSKVPTHNASFNIGHFKKYEYIQPELPKVNVFISESSHQKMANQLLKYEILSGANMEEKIGSDVLASLEFFQKVFGKIPLKEINVTEIPYYHGAAFPGLIHLPWYNYQVADYDYSGELMRAHEVAHQWWGIGVDFETYHDQWISEGFSEFSALYFIQTAFGNEAYFEILDKWKERIVSNRKYILGQGQEAGPIWLGYRTNSSETEGDYSLIVYEKGAWVIHMLRNLLIDLKTMREDTFDSLMKKFFKQYYGKNATIKDFQNLVNEVSGEDMNWFFDQFIYGTEVPSYHFSYTSENINGGKFSVTCKIVQNNVSDDFKMYVPIKILFSEDQFARVRLEVKGKTTTIKLTVPEKPADIIFNDLNSVLCEIE